MGSPERTVYGSPIPLSDIEDVLEWVDTFKLSRPTKKINRDFADAVLLAEMLAVAYPKLVEMHNYPARNSQAQKLNNWMTLNRKVLKKLKLNLCLKTMEQLSNSIPGAIERVLIMVKEKVKKDEEANKMNEDGEGQMSSGGSYYEACSEEDNVLIVPVKLKNGSTLETVQKKVVSHEVYSTVREQLRDAKEANETLKLKVDHFESLMKMKEERIEELQRQLARKATRRKENEDLKNSLSVPISMSEPPSPKIDPKYNVDRKPSETKLTEITIPNVATKLHEITIPNVATKLHEITIPNVAIKQREITIPNVATKLTEITLLNVATKQNEIINNNIKENNCIEPDTSDDNVVVKQEIIVPQELALEISNDAIDDAISNLAKEKKNDHKDIKSKIPIAEKLETKTSKVHNQKESIDNLFKNEINIVDSSDMKGS